MSIETNNSLEEKNKPTEKHDDIKKKFLKDFLKDYTTGSNKSQQIELLNSIYTSDSVGNDLKTKMTQFKNEDENLSIVTAPKYSGLQLEKITLHDLKEVSLKAYVTLQNRRNKLKTIIQSKYDIDNNEYDQKIQKCIQELSFDDLSKHIDSCSGFLKTIYNDTLPNTKKYSSFLDTFDFSKRMRDTLSLLTNEEKSILEELQYAREEGALFNSTELRQLFNIPFFNDEEKRELVHKCVGNITLRDATGLGIIDKNSQHYKDIKLYCIRAAGIKGLNDIDLEGISSSLSDNHILISTKHHCDGYSAVDKIASDILPEILEKQMEDARKQKEEELLEEGPQNAKELIQRVKIDKKLNEKITGIENFKENSFVQIEHKDSEGKTSYQAYKIGKVDQDIESGVPGFHFELFGGEKKGDTIEYVGGSGNQQKSYYDFCSVLSDMKDIQLNIITPDTLKEKESQGAICFQQASSKFKLQDEYRERINSIEEELKKDDIDDLERDKLESEKNEYYNKSLESIINELDPEGEKYGFSKGVTFATQKDSQGKIGYYTVTGISDNMIDIQTAQGVNIPTMHFEDFLNAWEQEKTKRVSNVGDINGIFDSVKKNDKLGEKWGNFEQKDGKIFRKDGSEKQNYEYDFLVSENSKEPKELIKIHAIHGDRVRISFGESEQKMDETKKGKGKMNTYFSVEEKIYDLHIGFLDNWIHKHQLIPRSLDEEKDIKETKGESVERHGSFWSRFFDRLSVADLLAGGKLYLDSIQNYLKEGQDELASRFANALWLPEELRNDMRARQDSAKKKRMDDYVTRLKEGNDAKEAVAMIVRWLLNKNAPEYKKEAGLTFMMEKYGVLYGKGPLMKYKGSFLWYEALGGKKGDELYNKIKEEEEARNQPFTEERLVWILLVKQCQPSGYNGIKRRSRFYKEIDGLIKKGYKDEVEDGSSKASSIRNHEDQVKSGMDELKGGNYPNAVGWMKGSMNKGGTVKNINKMPFIMLFSGEAYSMTEDSRNDIRGIPGREHHLVPILGFFSYNAQIKVFNNAVLRLCERIAEITGNNKIFERAQGIFNNSTQLGNNLDRIEECEDFYNEYGELIMNCLYGLHIETSDNYLNHIIQIEKEDHIDKNGKKQQGNKAFKDYAKAYKEMDPIHLSDDNMADQYKSAGWTGFDSNHAMEFIFQLQSGGSLKNPHSSKAMRQEFEEHVYRISNDPKLNYVHKKEILSKNIASLLYGAVKTGFKSLGRTDIFKSFLSKFTIDIKDLEKSGFSDDTLYLPKQGSREEEYINKIVDGIMNPKGDESDQGINEKTKTGVEDILEKH